VPGNAPGTALRFDAENGWRCGGGRAVSDDSTLVPIPTSLYRRVQSTLERAGQTSVEGFVMHAVRSALAAYEATEEPMGDEAKIVERLRRLGYID
jgi:hypothetical protein